MTTSTLTKLLVATAAAVGIAGCSGSDTATLTPRSSTEPTTPTYGEDCPHVEGGGEGVGMAIDYVDFVQAFDRQYVAGLGRNVKPASQHDLGEVVLRSRCAFGPYNDTTQGNPGEPRNGDTAFLPPGTPIHALDGWPTDCRLAAERDGQVVVYLAYRDDADHATPAPCAVRSGDGDRRSR